MNPLSNPLVIGLDSSTTACKAIAWDAAGHSVASGRTPIGMRKARPGWHEQSAADWWQAAALALRQVCDQVDPQRLAGVAIAAQRETFVVTGADGMPLGDALVWMDERAQTLLPEIDALYGKGRIHQETGKPLSANLSLAKLFWLRQHEPQRFDQISHVLDVHAYLAYQLTSRYVTSTGCADPMGLLDMKTAAWDAPLLNALDCKETWFPHLVSPGEWMGNVTTAAAHMTGLPAGLPIFAGTGDGQAAGLAVGVSQPGTAYLNLGTAVVSGIFSENYSVDPAFRTMTSTTPGAYLLETVLLGGTYTISWFVETFLPSITTPGAAEALLDAEAAQIPPGSDGLLLVPYWNTAMNPYWDAAASGVTLGWRGVHTRAHFYRAILEGIAFEQNLHTRGVETATGQPISAYRTVGGGSRSPLWNQILADVTGKTIQRMQVSEASALGAGMLAALGAGIYADFPGVVAGMSAPLAETYQPDPAHQARYAQFYAVYHELYPSLKAAMQQLALLSA